MYQFFVDNDQISNHQIAIIGSDVNHIKNVLRMKVGDEVAISNGKDGNEYRCIIEELRENEVLCKLQFVKQAGVELPSKIYLFQGLPKGDKMELIVQKAVELGAFQVIPVACKRSVVKLDDKKEKSKIQRWNGIAEAAAKQSKRMMIPEVSQVMTMKQAIQYVRDFDIKLIPYELAEDMSHTKQIFENIRTDQKIAVFIGPEGGFEEDEIDFAKANGILPITLGKRILRTETAGMAVLSWIMYLLES